MGFGEVFWWVYPIKPTRPGCLNPAINVTTKENVAATRITTNTSASAYFSKVTQPTIGWSDLPH